MIIAPDTAKCTYCSYSYCTDIAEDIEWHKQRHIAYEKAVRGLGYKPETHQEREASKEKAYAGLCSTQHFEAQIKFALQLFRAHFDRS